MFEIKSAELPLTGPRGVLRIGEVSGRPRRARVRFGDIVGSDGQKVTSRTKSPDSSFVEAIIIVLVFIASCPFEDRLKGEIHRLIDIYRREQ